MCMEVHGLGERGRRRAVRWCCAICINPKEKGRTHMPLRPRERTTSMVPCRCSTGRSACICMRILTISIGLVAITCVGGCEWGVVVYGGL